MTMEILRDTLHTLLCDLPHENNMAALLQPRDDCKCYYYLERSMTNQLELPDHEYWTDQCYQLMEMLRSTDPSVVLTSVYRVLNVLEKLNALSDSERELFALFYKPPQDDSTPDYCEVLQP